MNRVATEALRTQLWSPQTSLSRLPPSMTAAATRLLTTSTTTTTTTPPKASNKDAKWMYAFGALILGANVFTIWQEKDAFQAGHDRKRRHEARQSSASDSAPNNAVGNDLK